MKRNPNRITSKKLKKACCIIAARVFPGQDPDVEVFAEGSGCLAQVTCDDGGTGLFEAKGPDEYQALRLLLRGLAKILNARIKVDERFADAAMATWAMS